MKFLNVSKRSLGNQDGMALVLAIIVLGVLTVLTTQFGLEVRHHFFVSASYLETNRLSDIVESGLNIGVALLEVDRAENEYDTLVDNWAKVTSEQTENLFSKGKLKLTVIDELGRLPINRLGVQNANRNGLQSDEVKGILKKILLSGILSVESGDEVDSIVDAIQDWIDEDDDEREFGAESSYYLGLATPYECKNGSLESLDELLWVKGISAELLNGNSERPGLKDFLTVHDGGGLVNINTAPVALLRAIQPLITETMGQELVAFRQQTENIEHLADDRWYLDLPGWPDDIIFPEETITTRSDHFRIISEGIVGDHKRRLVAVVKREDKDKIILLSRYME